MDAFLQWQKWKDTLKPDSWMNLELETLKELVCAHSLPLSIKSLA
jgi:hypothetical protein